MSRAYYNEIDPYCAAWLRNLIRTGLIADGDVDERSITDVRPNDLRGYRQCHFFAGIGVWSYALRLAGWPDDREVWTGSCPCQPFSAAARGRHISSDLWHPYARLIAAGRPRTMFGEQVATAITWFDHVCDDLEALDYTIGAAILPACCVGADHARPRIFFVGDANGQSQSSLSVHAEMGWVSRNRGDARVVSPPDGTPARMGRLRAYGNAIVSRVAEAFIRAYLDVRG